MYLGVPPGSALDFDFAFVGAFASPVFGAFCFSSFDLAVTDDDVVGSVEGAAPSVPFC